MQQSPTVNSGSRSQIIGADMPLDSGRYPVRELLDAFRGAVESRPDLRLVIAGRRDQADDFLVWNYIDEHGLADCIEFLPYYDICREFPVKKQDCALWIERDTPTVNLTSERLLARLQSVPDSRPKVALFVTSFSPAKHEGNSALMRQWLDHLRRAGYRIHLVYYDLEKTLVTEPLRRATRRMADMVVEVDVATRLVGSNRNGLNVHVDDWCGIELLEAAERQVGQFEYDVALVNYSFLSATFTRVAAYTQKILITHDEFADRNRRMLAQGFAESGWLSLDRRGEALAFRRADVVVALQDEEAQTFQSIAGSTANVCVVAPVPEAPLINPPQRANKLRIGYLGSHNWVNELNLVAFLEEWALRQVLVEGSELVLAGGLCASLADFMPNKLMTIVSPRMLGEVESLYTFFEQCDIFINPERGGTGIKIKTLDAMAHGAAVLTTLAGCVGIGSGSRFHAAADAAGLADLVAECIDDQEMVEQVRLDTRVAYAAYVERHRSSLSNLLGTVLRPLHGERRQRSITRPTVVPEYVRNTASDYHFEEFEKIRARVNIQGKRVLELGSDFHLASARLFAVNGATEVVANNLWEWHSAEPLPPNVRYCAGDFSSVDLPEHSFDIVYGIAILEHVLDVDSIALAVRRMLKPGGVAYLQGCPLWTGALGHHIYLDASQTEGNPKDWEEGRPWTDAVYSFTDENKNPIPNWAHLNRTPNALQKMLVERGVPSGHAAQITNYVYNLDGKMAGACSNFKKPSEIVATFQNYFAVDCQRISYAEHDNPEFKNALETYSELDLSTLGLELWLTAPGVAVNREGDATPKVSIVIPFYNVEEYLEDCLCSIVDQDFQDFEIIIVDDQSMDGSRGIADGFAAAFDRIRIVTHAKNAGLGIARNTGVRYARGTYIFFLDSDDLLASPEALGHLVGAAERTGCHVVIGSCERLKPDGSILDEDRERDRQSNGKLGRIVRGIDAFMASLGLPGQDYLPIRAWGTLIQRSYYEELRLDFPVGEHEDMPTVPFLYFHASGVFYDPLIVVKYRVRQQSLSSTKWSAPKLQRYGNIWKLMKTRMEDCRLREQVGDAAAVFACHLMWKIECNGTTSDAANIAPAILSLILRDLSGATSRGLLFSILQSMTRQPWDALQSHARHTELTEKIPSWALVEFHRERLGVPALPCAPVPDALDIPKVPDEIESTNPAATALYDLQDKPSRLPFAVNASREAEIIAEYEAEASPRLKNFPAMLTTGDKAIYFHAAKHFGFHGTIVDGGCFVGGTTTSLVEGLRQNPLVRDGKKDIRGLIRVYDLFLIDDDYILQHLTEKYPEQEFKTQTSFLPIFEDNLRPDLELLQVRPGDVTKIGYHDAQPIEILGIDFCKAPFITDFTVRHFLPRLLAGGLVLQQDFVNEFHPHIHLSMLRLSDHFETFVELKWGGTVAYRCTKPVTETVVRERFGDDIAWYDDTSSNVNLLRHLIEDCHYDENRWIFLLTLGMYHHGQGRADFAVDAFNEAQARFPQFEPSALIRKLIGGQVP